MLLDATDPIHGICICICNCNCIVLHCNTTGLLVGMNQKDYHHAPVDWLIMFCFFVASSRYISWRGWLRSIDWSIDALLVVLLFRFVAKRCGWVEWMNKWMNILTRLCLLRRSQSVNHQNRIIRMINDNNST